MNIDTKSFNLITRQKEIVNLSKRNNPQLIA